MVKKKVSKKTSPKNYPKGYVVTSLVFAVIGFFLLLVFPQVMLVAFIIGWIFGYLSIKLNKTNFVLNIVGFIISVLWMLVAYLILIPFIASTYGGAF